MDITDSMEISEVARYTLDCSLVYYRQGWLVVSDDLIREQDSFQSATSLVNAEVSVKELVLRRRKSVVLQCPQNRRRSQSSPHSISTSQKESSSSVVCSRCGSTLLAIATAVKDHVGNCNYNISAQIAPEGSRLCH